MTSRKLEALNRQTRIVALARKGVPYGEIATQENVSDRYVSYVARKFGICRLAGKAAGGAS